LKRTSSRRNRQRARKRRAQPLGSFPQSRVARGGQRALARVGPIILPATMDCVMPYSITANLTTVNPGIGDWLFRGNSPYDPDYTGVGGYTAIGWPELSGIYQKMIARACLIVVSFKSNTSGHQAVVIVFPTTDTNSRVATASDILRYKPHAVSKVVSGGGDENRRTDLLHHVSSDA